MHIPSRPRFAVASIVFASALSFAASCDDDHRAVAAVPLAPASLDAPTSLTSATSAQVNDAPHQKELPKRARFVPGYLESFDVTQVHWNATALSPHVVELEATVMLFADTWNSAEAKFEVDLGEDLAILVGLESIPQGDDGDAKTIATLDDDEVSSDKFHEFRNAVLFGSKDGAHVVAGAPIAPALLASTEDGRIEVRAVFPRIVDEQNSIRKVLRLRFLVLGEPTPAGEAFKLPVVVDGDEPVENERFVTAPSKWGDCFLPRNDATVPSSLVLVPTRLPSRRFFVQAIDDTRVVTSGATVFAPGKNGGVSAVTASLHLPAQLTRTLDAVHLIFVVDRSASFGPELQRASWALAAEVVDAATASTSYSVVEFGRRASVTARGRHKSNFLRSRAQQTTSENGSALFEALRLARNLASDDGDGVTTRIIVMSDADLGLTSNDADIAHNFSRANAVTHLVGFSENVRAVDVSRGFTNWQRSFGDDAVVSSGVEVTGGIDVRVDRSSEPSDELSSFERRELVTSSGPLLARHLVTPQKLERLSFESEAFSRATAVRKDAARINGGVYLRDIVIDTIDGSVPNRDIRYDADVFMSDGSDEFPSAMVGGESIRVVTAERGNIGSTSFRGFLWADRVSFDVVRDRMQAMHDVTPGLIANRLGHGYLDDEEGGALATLSHSVSPWTSLLGLPVWRPDVVVSQPTDCGIGAGGHSCGGSGSSSCGGYRGPGRETTRYEVDLLAMALADILKRFDLDDSPSFAISFSDKEILSVVAIVDERLRSDRETSNTLEIVRESLWRVDLTTLAQNMTEKMTEKLADDVKYSASIESQFQTARTVTVSVDAKDERSVE